MAHLYRFGMPNLDECYNWYRCQDLGTWVEKMSRFRTWDAKPWKTTHRVHALDVHSLLLAKTSCKQFQDWGSQVLKMAWCHEIPHCVFCKRHVQALKKKQMVSKFETPSFKMASCVKNHAGTAPHTAEKNTGIKFPLVTQFSTWL